MVVAVLAIVQMRDAVRVKTAGSQQILRKSDSSICWQRQIWAGEATGVWR